MSRTLLPRVGGSGAAWMGPLLFCLSLFLPFDSVRPLFALEVAGVGVEFSLLELLVLPLVVLFLPVLWKECRGRIEHERGRFVLAVSILWIFCAILSASLAGDFRWHAFRYVSRLALFSLLFWSIRAWLWNGGSRASIVLVRGLVLGSLLSAAIALFSWARPEAAEPLLSFFRFGPSHAAGIARASATFPYPTIAALHFEMLVPLGLVLALRDRSQPWRWAGGIVTGASLLLTVFTWTRSGVIALGLVLPLAMIIGAVAPRLSQWTRPLLLSLVGLCASVALLMFSTQDAALRLRTESDLNWVGAVYRVPEAITGPVAGHVSTWVVVENTGERGWDPERKAGESSGGNALGGPATSLEGRWLSADKQWLLDESDLRAPSLRFALPRTVEPGDTVRVPVEFDLPEIPGSYGITWGLVLEDLYAFRHRGVEEQVSPVTVRPVASEVDPRSPDALSQVRRTPLDLDLPPHAWNVPRRDLWYAALEFFRSRPVLGIGPGTFRFRYGEPLGAKEFDERVHPNNLYLQLLAEQGVVGLGLFLLLVVAVAVESQFWRDATRFAAALAVAIFLVHSLADGFMGFVSSYTLFAMCLALLSAGSDRT